MAGIFFINCPGTVTQYPTPTTVGVSSNGVLGVNVNLVLLLPVEVSLVVLTFLASLFAL